MTKIENIQAALRDRGIDACLFCDHHHRDATEYRILGPGLWDDRYRIVLLKFALLSVVPGMQASRK
jgi:histidinol phosphatase-like enzyme